MTQFLTLGQSRYDILISIMGQNILDSQSPISLADKQLGAVIESLLFVSGRPLERAELRKLLDADEQRLSNALRALNEDLDSHGRGIRLQTLWSGFPGSTTRYHSRRTIGNDRVSNAK